MSVLQDIDLSLLLDGLSDSIVAADASGQIVYANRAAAELFGWAADELVGQPLTALMPPRLHAAHRAGFERYITTREAKIIGRPIRVAALRKNGTEFDAELSLSALERGDGTLLLVAALRDVGARILLERELSGERMAKDRLVFLAEAGALLDASLDYRVTLERVARLAVPRLADYCLVDIVEDNGDIRRVATAHRDPEKEPLLRTTEDRYLVARSDHPAARAIRTGAPVIHEGVTEQVWAETARDDDHLRVVQALAPHSWMFLPLTARSRALGTIAFVLTDTRRSFSEDDKVLAQELTRRAALAVDNARLYTAERTERERLYSLFMQAPAAIAIVRGPEFRYELSNPLHQELAQGRILVGKTVVEALPELEAQGLYGLLTGVYESGEPFIGTEVPVTLPTPAGDKTLYMNGVYQPLRGADGSVEAVMVFAYEVTEQVLARRKVEQAERRFRTLATHAPVGIFLTDENGDCEFVNPRWCELAGMTADEAAKQGWVRALHPEDKERVFQEWYEAARTARAFETRYRFMTPAGHVSWLQGSAIALTDSSGTVTGYLGTITDVTEREKSEQDRERLLSDLQHAVRQRDDFLSVASHELRTPLATLRIHTEMLRRMITRPLPDSAERMVIKVDKIERQVVKLEDLIRTLLDVSRVTQGKLELRKEQMNLSELVAEVTTRFSDEADEAECVLRLSAKEAVLGNWDRVRVDQVVTNLLTNAIKYSKGHAIDIEVTSSKDNARVRIVDRGIGVPAGDRARIFERFERAVSSRHYAGLGLGLWIARQIIESHAGSIAVSETPGGGATFTIELPRE